MKRGKGSSIDATSREVSPPERILEAAFAAFTEEGFAAARTLDIATRARVSKRALYALFGSKQQILVTCISERAQRMRWPADLAAPRNGQELEARLAEFGRVVLSEVTHSEVIALVRLAVSEADRSPEVGQALERYGRGAVEAALRKILNGARTGGLLANADVETLVSRFMPLLLDDLPLSLALGLRDRPDPQEIGWRAAEAARTVLQLAAVPA